jgi:hypothetical protein
MKIVDGDITKVEEIGSKQEKLPHGLSSMILGIVSISICLFYGSGIVVALIARSQIKKDEPLYQSEPVKYEKSYKMIQVAKTTSTLGVWVSAGILATMITMVIFDEL